MMSIKNIATLAAVAVGGYALYRVYSAGSNVIDGIKSGAAGLSQAASQAAAEVTQAWNNATGGRPAAGDPVRAALYSDAGYGGLDPMTGQAVITGEFFDNEEARRYTYEQAAAGGAPAAVSINGAAFGVYPKAKTIKPAPAVDPRVLDRWDAIVYRDVPRATDPIFADAF